MESSPTSSGYEYIAKHENNDMKSHRGTDYRIQQGLLNDRYFEDILDPLKDFKNIDGKSLIICVCRSGKHRSEAARAMIHTHLKLDYYDTFERSGGIATIQLQAGDVWRYICVQGNCAGCDYDPWMHGRVPNDTPVQHVSTMASRCDMSRRRIKAILPIYTP